MSQSIVVLTTVSSEEEGGVIAKVLVEEQLAACVNMIPKVKSFYIYEGSFCEDQEVQLLIKTNSENFIALEKMIKELHSYTLPEIIAIPIVQASKEYLSWIDQNS